MDNFNFIPTFITQFFTNSGLTIYFTFCFGAFGLAILYKVVMTLFKQKL